MLYTAEFVGQITLKDPDENFVVDSFPVSVRAQSAVEARRKFRDNAAIEYPEYKIAITHVRERVYDASH